MLCVKSNNLFAHPPYISKRSFYKLRPLKIPHLNYKNNYLIRLFFKALLLKRIGFWTKHLKSKSGAF